MRLAFIPLLAACLSAEASEASAELRIAAGFTPDGDRRAAYPAPGTMEGADRR